MLKYNNCNDKYDYSLFTISDRHLSEEVRDYDNIVKYMTGFTGDTAMFLYGKKKSYLIIDGRFEVQVKKEIKGKNINIVVLDASYNLYDFLEELFIKELKNKKHLTFSINPKVESINKINKIIDIAHKLNQKVKIVFDEKHVYSEFYKYRKNIFHMTSAPLFRLSNKRPILYNKKIIKTLLNNNDFYISSDKAIIAYLTNLRYEFSDIDNIGVLFDSFIILNNKKAYIYIHDYLTDDLISDYKKNNIIFKNYDDFYKDIKTLVKKKSKVLLDKANTSFDIYKRLNNAIIDYDTAKLEEILTIRSNEEIKNIEKVNIIDGLSMVRAIYNIKKMTKNSTVTEYDIKEYIDNERRKNKTFLCPSFPTISAYNDNSAICHYVPSKKSSKIVKNDGILLIDSGGHYIGGTTDITRTISLYKSNVPYSIKKDYTLVLKSLLRLESQKFPYGYTGRELDLIAREGLYNELLDFNHGTGHGIGYVTNVHEGPNNLSPGISMAKENNILEINQINSIEPGIYKAGKYGIRLENDVYIKHYKDTEYGEFLEFVPLTLCPFDTSLIDKKMLDKKEIKILNDYNKLVYDKLSKYLDNDIKKWLYNETKKI